MSESSIVHIRESIALAREQEKESQQLKRYLQARLPQLHPSIALPDENADQALLQFVQNYIEQVPDFLEALQEFMQGTQIDVYGKIFIAIAEDFFLQPPEMINHHQGMHALIDEAYLAHRLMEELNDRLEMRFGTTLAPLEMTFSNIIIHDIIGEDFANQLDLAVHYAVEAVFQNEELQQQLLGSAAPQLNNYWDKRIRSSAWAAALQRWPSLCSDGISLKLGAREAADTAIH